MEKKRPILVEDSDFATVAPLLDKTVQRLTEADKFDYIMAFFIAFMAQNNYHVSSLYNPETCSWNDKTCIPADWKRPGTNIYDINFSMFIQKRYKLDCTLIGIPTGDWMVLNLVPKGTSPACQTRSMAVNVAKYVNLHLKELGKFWHLKELASKFKSELLLPVHSEILLEVGVASPCLQGIPQNIMQMIFELLDPRGRRNLERALKKRNTS